MTFDDLAKSTAPCVDRGHRQLDVTGGTTCTLPVPDSGSLPVCVMQGAVTVVVKGSDYPAQRFRSADLGCGQRPQIDLYDRKSVMGLACLLGPPCLLKVGRP